jgi:hypothetical protein
MIQVESVLIQSLSILREEMRRGNVSIAQHCCRIASGSLSGIGRISQRSFERSNLFPG